jgi:hypothetical protein
LFKISVKGNPFTLNLKTAVEEWCDSRKASIGKAFRRFQAAAEQFLLGDYGKINIIF